MPSNPPYDDDWNGERRSLATGRARFPSPIERSTPSPAQPHPESLPPLDECQRILAAVIIQKEQAQIRAESAEARIQRAKEILNTINLYLLTEDGNGNKTHYAASDIDRKRDKALAALSGAAEVKA